MKTTFYQNKKFLIALFAFIMVIQWYVPLQMYFAQKNILKTGTAFKFKTQPVDPYDAFRGKFINLNYEIGTCYFKDSIQWEIGQTVYAKIINDSLGFAKIDSIFKFPPKSTSNYVKVKVSTVFNENGINIEFPFNRYYMEETKAPQAEKMLRQRNTDTIPNLTYSIVRIKDGKSALEKVMVNEKSIDDYEY